MAKLIVHFCFLQSCQNEKNEKQMFFLDQKNVFLMFKFKVPFLASFILE